MALSNSPPWRGRQAKPDGVVTVVEFDENVATWLIVGEGALCSSVFQTPHDRNHPALRAPLRGRGILDRAIFEYPNL